MIFSFLWQITAINRSSVIYQTIKKERGIYQNNKKDIDFGEIYLHFMRTHYNRPHFIQIKLNIIDKRWVIK